MRCFLLSIFIVLFTILLLSAQDEWKDRKELPDDFIRPPKTEKSLFFIQRNKNHNTIVYDLNFKEDGQLNKRNPIDAYWRRYGSTGARKELSWLESMLAYGYRSKKNKDGSFRIKLRAYNERYIQLKKIDNKWRAIMEVNGEACYLNNIYAYADESGVFPDVLYVDIYGTQVSTGEVIKERILD